MVRFEYLVVRTHQDRVLTANGHWQGTVPWGEDGDVESCPGFFGYLEEAGAQGWDLVGVVPEAEGQSTLYFKRAR